MLTVSNPGPGDFSSTVVAFSRVGDPSLPGPIVEPGRRASRAVRAVEPKPVAVSPDGVVYTFEGIAEGESRTFVFTVRLPEKTGSFGNAVQVYDGGEPDRARGVRLQTRVER